MSPWKTLLMLRSSRWRRPWKTTSKHASSLLALPLEERLSKRWPSPSRARSWSLRTQPYSRRWTTKPCIMRWSTSWASWWIQYKMLSNRWLRVQTGYRGPCYSQQESSAAVVSRAAGTAASSLGTQPLQFSMPQQAGIGCYAMPPHLFRCRVISQWGLLSRWLRCTPSTPLKVS